ncbi:MAG: GNAT family N-acetyltransferase [Gemmatimonadota bacterium]
MNARDPVSEAADDVVIRPLRSLDEYRACVELQERTWGEGFAERVPVSHLILVQRIGGIAAGAFDTAASAAAADREVVERADAADTEHRGGTLIGFVYGVTGIEDRRPVHWSDMLAVAPEHRNRGIGERLKRYQRDRLLPLGVETVYWTCDPLESRNAFLNFARLGVVCGEYRRNLYGDTDSPLHTGIGTDRFVVRWPIASARVRRRLEGSEPPPTIEDDVVASIPVVNPTRPVDDDGTLRCDPPDLSLDSPRLRIAIPADIQRLKTDAPDAALAWRRHTRTAFEHFFDRGYHAVDAVRDGDRTFYLLDGDPTLD